MDADERAGLLRVRDLRALGIGYGNVVLRPRHDDRIAARRKLLLQKQRDGQIQLVFRDPGRHAGRSGGNARFQLRASRADRLLAVIGIQLVSGVNDNTRLFGLHGLRHGGLCLHGLRLLRFLLRLLRNGRLLRLGGLDLLRCGRLRPGGDRRFPDPVQSEKQTARCKQHGCRQSRRDDLLFHILISDSISKFLNSMIFRISASRIRA